MQTTELSDIRATVEEIRQELHPDLGSAFLAAVVDAEESNIDDDSAAMRLIEQALAVEIARQEPSV